MFELREGAGEGNHRLLRAVCLAAFVLAGAGCGESSTDPAPMDEGVDFAELFAAPTSGERDAILAEWSNRDPAARDVVVEATSALSLGGTPSTVHVVSHTVDGSTHYGAVAAPDGAAAGSLPILVYLHGGDDGVDVDQLVTLLPLLVTGFQDSFVLVAPSFRSEPLTFDGTTYRSTGAASPWDRDVDDSIALLNAAVGGLVPAADPERIGVIGFSRGAAVGLLMAERDDRIDLVVEFFGPTDFFGPFVQEVTRDALNGTLRNLPGLDALNEQFLQPLDRGELSVQSMRLELLRRSPVYFAEALPDLQIHHGTADTTVPVGEAERLIQVMEDLGRGIPELESYIYAGGTHSPLTLNGSLSRTATFLERLTSPALVASGR